MIDFGVLTPLSAIFQLYHGDHFYWWKKPEYPERTIDHGQATGKLYDLRLRVECNIFVIYDLYLPYIATILLIIHTRRSNISSKKNTSYNSYKPITNTAWVCPRLFKLQKGCTRLAAASDKAYQLLTHGRWFSLGTPASSTTKNGRHYIAEILLKVTLRHKQSKINQSFSIKVLYAVLL